MNLRLLFCLLSLVSNTAHAAAWEAVANLNVARNSLAAGIIDNNIVVFGGVNYFGEMLNSTEILDLNNPTAWQLADSTDKLGVSEMSGASNNGQFYVFGASSAIAYSSTANTWRDVDVQAPSIRSKTSAIQHGDDIFVFGGHTQAGGKIRYLKTIEAYNPADNQWRSLKAMPIALEGMALASVDSYIYAFGGLQVGKKAVTGVLRYHPAEQKWQRSGFTPLPFPRLFPVGHAAPILDGKIYLLGGASLNHSLLEATDNVVIYDPISNTWQTGPRLPHPLLGHVAVASDDAIYVIGGTGGDNSLSSKQVWKLTDSWKKTLNEDQTCDLNADGKFSALDVTLFTQACKAKSAYWKCNLNGDTGFNSKDITLYKAHWKDAKAACPEIVPDSSLLTLSANGLNFGNIDLGGSNTSEVIKLTNTGNAPLSIDAITSSNPVVFALTTNCGNTLDIGASCNLSVQFSPLTAGISSGSISIISSDASPDSSQTIKLTGSGVAPSPIATLSVTSLNFGSQAIGSTSPAQSINLSNTGKAPLVINSIGSSSNAFVVSSDCGAGLAVSTSCTISCSFSPIVFGNNSAKLSINTNASTPATISLQGLGNQDSPNVAVIANAFANKLSNIQVESAGKVTKLLADDLVGDRHQRFIVQLSNGQTLLVAHNIDIAPRINVLKTNDTVAFYGEYEWSSEGGVMHWTHHDPSGSHVAGWLKHNNVTYQ
ncbi:MAG: DUF3465 domain-containing protein [Methylococcales bacterium]|nr:DUF3465 domain-containing protein [Methylococcaceae bacterium]